MGLRAGERGAKMTCWVLHSSHLMSLLPSERETNKPLFVKCHLPGSKASWTEMARVNQRWFSVPRLSRPWCQSLCAGRPCVPSWWAQAINSDATRLSAVDSTISRNHHQLTDEQSVPCGHLCPLYWNQGTMSLYWHFVPGVGCESLHFLFYSFILEGSKLPGNTLS